MRCQIPMYSGGREEAQVHDSLQNLFFSDFRASMEKLLMYSVRVSQGMHATRR
jgi:hypothetical protein